MLYPKATKTGLVNLLRSRGYTVPSIRQAQFSGGGAGRAWRLRWEDPQRVSHIAYYTGCAGRPILQVDKEWLELTMAEVIHFGLVEEK